MHSISTWLGNNVTTHVPQNSPVKKNYAVNVGGGRMVNSLFNSWLDDKAVVEWISSIQDKLLAVWCIVVFDINKTLHKQTIQSEVSCNINIDTGILIEITHQTAPFTQTDKRGSPLIKKILFF